MTSRRTPTAAQLARFGALIAERRDELGLRQEDISAAGGGSPSTTTLSHLERGTATGMPQHKTLAGIEKGLRLVPRSAWRALLNDEPLRPLIDGSDAVDRSSDALTLSPEHRDRLVQILRNASQGLNAVSQGLDEAIHVLGG